MRIVRKTVKDGDRKVAEEFLWLPTTGRNLTTGEFETRWLERAACTYHANLDGYGPMWVFDGFVEKTDEEIA